MTKLMRALLPLSCLGVGLMMGWMMRPTAPMPPPSATMERAAPPALQEFVERAQLGTMIRGIVREEMERSAGRPAPAAAASPSAPKAETAPEPTAAQVTARDSGQSIIAAARSAGRWTEDDRMHFREAMAGLDDSGRAELLQTLLPAINRQEIKLEFHGPPI